MTTFLTREQLQSRLASDRRVVLLEALPAHYFLDGHLPGAKHLPHVRVGALVPAIVPDKKTPIIVYCASATCNNSHIAALKLEALGYTDVSVYSGGKQDWTDAGLPLEKGGIAQDAA